MQLRDRLVQGTRQGQGLAAAAAGAADAGPGGEQLARVQAGHDQRRAQGQHDGGEPDPAARRGQCPGVRAKTLDPASARPARRVRPPVPVEPVPVEPGAVEPGAPGSLTVPRRRAPQRYQAAPDPDAFPPVGAQHGQVARPAQAEHHCGGELAVRGVHGDRHGEQDEQRQPGQCGGPQPHRDEVGQHGGDAYPAGGQQQQAGQVRGRRCVPVSVVQPGTRQVPQPGERARCRDHQQQRVPHLEDQVQVQQQAHHAGRQADRNRQRAQPGQGPGPRDGDHRAYPDDEP